MSTTQLSFNPAGAEKLSVVTVPKFLADGWAEQPPGTIIGAVTPNSHVLKVSREQGHPVTTLKPDTTKTSQVVWTAHGPDLATSAQQGAFAATQPAFWGKVDSATQYLPSAKDRYYQQYLMKGLKPTSRLTKAEPVRIQDDISAPQPAQYLFQFFEGGQGPYESTTKQNQVSIEQSKAALFSLFEQKGPEGVTLKEIQQNVHLPSHQLRKLLDQLVEPQRERWGKNTTFVLKQQYQVR